MRPLEVTEAFYESLLGASVHLPDELLLCAVEGRATARERSRIEAHLAGCGRCRADFQALQHFAERQPSAPAPSLIIAALPEQVPGPSAPPELTLTEDPEPLPMSPPALRFAEAPAAGVAVSKSRAPAPAPWIALAFLALNALGLGAVYRAFSTQRAPAKAAPVVSAAPQPPQGESSADRARFQAAYERQLAQERGKLAQLEKQLQALRLTPRPLPPQGKPTVPPALPQAKRALGVKTKQPALLRPTSLPLTALSVHPELTWKPVPKASRYSAELTDATGKSVSKSELRQPLWRVAAALQRGETYRWSVTPLDRESKPLGEAQIGELTITTEEVATRLSDQLKALATELEGVGLTTDAALLRERGELLLKK